MRLQAILSVVSQNRETDIGRHAFSYRGMQPMNSSPPALTSEEQEQLLQTIEMFEVIVQASPQDCQSMEILKDAYYRLGRQSEALAISRRLADSYVELGQFSQAVIEYESILQNDPANPEVIAALGEVEERLYRSAQARR